MPQVLGVVEAALGLDAVMNIPIPGGTNGLEQAGGGDAIGAFEDEAFGGQLDTWRAACEALSVRVAPGAERMQLEPHRTECSHHAVRDRDCRPSMIHGDLTLDGDIAHG